jgi:alanine-glyoxylate transaminase/serine-glyoxylate transaminase/serine-pyruvate transaminase
MSVLPGSDRILLGPGPSLTSPRVMRAMASPTVGHLDPAMVAMLDDIRARLARTFRAADGSFAFAVSGTGTSGMETTVANLVQDGTRVQVVVSGYFGDRIAQMCRRYGATVTRLEVEWGGVRSRGAAPRADRVAGGYRGAGARGDLHGRAAPDPQSRGGCARAGRARAGGRGNLVRRARARSRRVGGDACCSCTQKCLSAPAGLAPVGFGPRALDRRVRCRSFYFDVQLLEDYWLRRKYHHTMSSALACALDEALAIDEEEGLEARWARHQRNHRAFVDGLKGLDLGVLPPERERLWTLNAVRVPDGIDEAAVRRHLLEEFNVEIGAGLGPLAGKIWRIGLMGAGSAPRFVLVLLGALESALARQGRRLTA